MIADYNQYLMENNLKKAPVLKVPTDQEVADAEKILAENINPEWDKQNLGYFIIDVSGKYHVYYTLWRFKPSKSQYVNSMVYITNLSTDFMTAINKAKKICGRTPIEIDRFGTHAGLFKAQKAQILTFGKYRGSSMGEIFAQDPKYLVWLADNYEGKNQERFELLKYYKELYYENITKQNRESGVSTYVGNIGDEIEKEFILYKMEKKAGFNSGDSDTNFLKFRDLSKNQYVLYWSKELPTDTKIGDHFIIKAKVKDHFETLGLKFTRLSYIKKFDNKSAALRKHSAEFDL